eukprot:Protomagalhaensia_sp_Gyna_25__4745@NODE_468_length_3354_cov_23_027149_g362_i0_p3_GENE_NODE_468_length_3354_cov_23_027149_g362_i0NODE_468_length_3354_cov_23_027149_g362_i0_p3_ORF_typecomplete_len159_score34_82Eapp_C/PF10238_9/0_0017YippeeMis18/PF03226_14/0_0025SelR/PF01641_18/0_23FAM72/PF14976_6/1_5e02FAM72/PF14976_6/1_6Ribosomal_S27e/PF01667_17/3_4e02Ribosomal_S27e/PF01667_17/1_3HECT_2/PF09814_9/0_56_NODE_468_length_3354_cov_23_027149_g362_i013131789
MEEEDDWVPIEHNITLQHRPVKPPGQAEEETDQREELYNPTADKQDETFFNAILEGKDRTLVACANCFADLAYDPKPVAGHRWELSEVLTRALNLQAVPSEITKKRRAETEIPIESATPTTVTCAQCDTILGQAANQKVLFNTDSVYTYRRSHKAPGE